MILCIVFDDREQSVSLEDDGKHLRVNPVFWERLTPKQQAFVMYHEEQHARWQRIYQTQRAASCLLLDRYIINEELCRA